MARGQPWLTSTQRAAAAVQQPATECKQRSKWERWVMAGAISQVVRCCCLRSAACNASVHTRRSRLLNIALERRALRQLLVALDRLQRRRVGLHGLQLLVVVPAVGGRWGGMGRGGLLHVQQGEAAADSFPCPLRGPCQPSPAHCQEGDEVTKQVEPGHRALEHPHCTAGRGGGGGLDSAANKGWLASGGACAGPRCAPLCATLACFPPSHFCSSAAVPAPTKGSSTAGKGVTPERSRTPPRQASGKATGSLTRQPNEQPVLDHARDVHGQRRRLADQQKHGHVEACGARRGGRGAAQRRVSNVGACAWP